MATAADRSTAADASLTERAFAKINLTLRVVARRADGYHALESLVAFADIADTLTLTPGAPTTLAVDGDFAAASGPSGDNLVLKAAAALSANAAGLRGGRFRLEKRIPAAAGLGGGSADAAAALRLLARANKIASDDPRLAAAARNTGADVPVCLYGSARIMRGIGDELSHPLVLPELPAVLIHPGVPLATKEVFAAFKSGPGSAPLSDIPRDPQELRAFLRERGNDLEPAAISLRPAIAEVLSALRAQGAVLARMSGSGAACFGLFATAEEASAAGSTLRDRQRNWWVHTGTIG